MGIPQRMEVSAGAPVGNVSGESQTSAHFQVNEETPGRDVAAESRSLGERLVEARGLSEGRDSPRGTVTPGHISEDVLFEDKVDITHH